MIERQSKAFKPAMCALLAVLLIAVSFIQKELNRDRTTMGLTRVTVLENAPPVLAFTTVALGGFRGLICNALWIRAMELQDDGKYFEMVQLADWITKLQPYFSTIWVVQAWNMAYNISIKFDKPEDRWMWVSRGIELLRDQGLKYNPKETLIYRELSWFYQHKIGSYLDDAQMYYKYKWASEMGAIFPNGHPDYEKLTHPTNVQENERARNTREKFKLDPVKMKEVDEHYGPFDWRLPETHAVYWAYIGLQYSKREELMTLRRSIYQDMQTSFQRGKIVENKFDNSIELVPNLDIVPNASKAYEEMMKEEPDMRDHIATGHRNFLKDAVYFLYVNNRRADAERWLKYIKEKYPNAMLDKPPIPIRDLSLDEYAVSRVMEEVGETSQDKTTQLIVGMMTTAYQALALDNDDQFTGLSLLVQRIWDRYQQKIGKQSIERVGLKPLPELKRSALDAYLPKIPAEAAGIIRTKLGLPPPPPTTDAPPAQASQPANPPANAPAKPPGA